MSYYDVHFLATSLSELAFARVTGTAFINDFLEATNGVTALLVTNLIVFLFWFLRDQMHRAALKPGELLLHFAVIPVVMQVTIGILTLLSGIWLTRVVVWEWRSSTDGRLPFNGLEIAALSVASLVTAVGALCLMRVMTRPAFGHLPWVLSAAEGVVFVLAFIFLR